jgi:ADP-ribose pyrophosphatase
MATIDNKSLLDGSVRPIVSAALPRDNILQIFHIREGDNCEDAKPGIHIRISNTAEGTNIPLAFIDSFMGAGRGEGQNVLNSPPLVRIREYSSVLEVRDIVEGEDTNLKSGAYYRWVRPYGSVLVPVVVESDGTVKVLMQQVYRHQIGAPGWEFPMGGVKEGESPSDGARREMLEETGFMAEEIIPVIEGYTDPGSSTARETFFVGRGLREVSEMVEENEKIGELTAFSLERTLKMLDAGEIDRLETATGILSIYRMVREGKLEGAHT